MKNRRLIEDLTVPLLEISALFSKIIFYCKKITRYIDFGKYL